MKVSQRLHNQLYQHLGYLFYAIAASDRTVAAPEFEILRQHVRKYWMDIETGKDSGAPDAAFQMEVIFEILHEDKATAMSCFTHFAEFKKKNGFIFTPDINELIWNTAEAIASSFSGKNKSELVYLSKLAILLSQTSETSTK